MATIHDLVGEIADPQKRKQFEAALKAYEEKQKFGLVYESHRPETTALPGLAVTVGAEVQIRTEPANRTVYCVAALVPTLEGMTATLTVEHSDDVRTMPLDALMVVKRFGEPIFPGLAPVGQTRQGGDTKPAHAVINAENYHAAQLLCHLYERQADCIYLDPPYNTGARDWTYNNDYVDGTDVYRHSKWLSFMEKRLALAKRLLKPDGMLIASHFSTIS